MIFHKKETEKIELVARPDSPSYFFVFLLPFFTYLESMDAKFRVSRSNPVDLLAREKTLILQFLNCFLVLMMCGMRSVSPPSS